MAGADACYHLAGIAGVNPRGLTLRQVWRMAVGAIACRRQAMVEQAQLIWAADQMDLERYLLFGDVSDTGRGGPVRMSPELQRKVDAEIARIRAENPGLPPVTYG